jgi:hypothetical protein
MLWVHTSVPVKLRPITKDADSGRPGVHAQLYARLQTGDYTLVHVASIVCSLQRDVFFEVADGACHVAFESSIFVYVNVRVVLHVDGARLCLQSAATSGHQMMCEYAELY